MATKLGHQPEKSDLLKPVAESRSAWFGVMYMVSDVKGTCRHLRRDLQVYICPTSRSTLRSIPGLTDSDDWKTQKKNKYQMVFRSLLMSGTYQIIM